MYNSVDKWLFHILSAGGFLFVMPLLRSQKMQSLITQTVRELIISRHHGVMLFCDLALPDLTDFAHMIKPCVSENKKTFTDESRRRRLVPEKFGKTAIASFEGYMTVGLPENSSLMKQQGKKQSQQVDDDDVGLHLYRTVTPRYCSMLAAVGTWRNNDKASGMASGMGGGRCHCTAMSSVLLQTKSLFLSGNLYPCIQTK